jgi:hypothetical protein
VVALLMAQNTKQVQGLDILRLSRQNSLIRLCGRPQLPRAVHFDSVG